MLTEFYKTNKLMMNAKKTRWRYTCDANQNGLADSDERSMMAVVNKKKFNNIDFDCGSDDNCFNCKKKDLKSFIVPQVTYEDGLIIECVATDWAKAKAKYRYGCDANGNGVIDDGESTKDVNVQMDNDGACTRKEFPFECRMSILHSKVEALLVGYLFQTQQK